MHKRTIRIDGSLIDYIDSAKENRDAAAHEHLPLVMLHGLGGNATSFSHQFSAFAPARRVVAWHAPGYGNSDVVDATGNVYANRLLAFLSAIDIERCVLLGHSMGGMLAGKVIDIAPARVAALILSCTHGGYASDGAAPISTGQQKRLDELRLLSAEEYGLARAKAMSAANATPEAVDALKAIAAQTRYEGLEAAIKMINGLNNLEALGHYGGPTLIIDGDEDRVIAAVKREALHDAMPEASRIVVEGAGHAPYLEKPQAYNQALQAFFSTLTSVT